MAFNGTGSNVTSLNAANISSGTLAVGRGGTGATTLNAAAVIIGNGTSAPTFVAPGTSGNLLTSNGSAWSSTAPAAPTIADGSVTDVKISDGLTADTTYYSIMTGAIQGTTGSASLQKLVSVRCYRGGTFNFRLRIVNTNESSGNQFSRIYVNGSAVGSQITTFVSGGGAGATQTHTSISVSRNQIVDVYGSGDNGSNSMNIGYLQYGTTGNNSISAFGVIANAVIFGL
jgi:hypothetical protein